MTIGEQIKKNRQEKGLSQKALGQLLGVSQQMVGQYESPNANLKLGTLQKIAIALDIDINNLLNSTLEDSPVYRALKRNNSLDSDFAHDFLNRILTERIDWQPIDIEMIKIFKTLNETGQTKAIERIEELTEIPRYTKKEKNLTNNEE